MGSIQSHLEPSLLDDDPTLVVPVAALSKAAQASAGIQPASELLDDPTLVAPVAALSKAAQASASVQRDAEPDPEFARATPSEPGASSSAREGLATPGRLTGTLEDLSVADVVQILQLAQKGAVIRVTHEGVESRLWCSAGGIIDAERGRLRGEAALHRILGLESGSMVADLRAEPRERTIFGATPHLLLDAARRKDESAELRRRLGDELRCYRVGALADPAGMSAVELSLLHGFRNLQTLREAIDSSEFGELETLTALLRCIGAGYLVDTGARGSKRPVPAADSSRGRARSSPGSATLRKYSRWRWRPSSRPWFALALAAATLLPLGYLAGRSAAHLLLPSGATTEPARVAGPAASTALSDRAIGLRVEPPEAKLWLDGRELDVGQLPIALVRDGAVHELRLSAPGFVPARVLFGDVAPPAEISLEPLPIAACADRVPSQPPAAADAPALPQPGATTTTPKSHRAHPSGPAGVREAPHSVSPRASAALENRPPTP